MMRHRNPGLYYLVLLLLAGVVLAALGGGLFGQVRPWPLQWQHRMFAGLCHQLPARSFWINGQPMAVCSRCFGIYTSLLLGWMVLPLAARVKPKSFLRPRLMFFGFFLLNSVDVLGNWLGIWHNTLESRLILGGLMGFAAAMLFSGVFFITAKTNKQWNYGAITTRGARSTRG